MYLGCHLSITKGFKSAAETAVSIGANSFQFFTRNPRGGRAKEIDPKDIIGLREIMETYEFGPLFAHGSYTMNLSSDKEDVREFANMVLMDDMRRLAQLPENTIYVFHPGSHVGQGAEVGIQFIVDALKEAVKVNPHANIALEGMSGKGTEIGYRFEQLKDIIDGVGHESIGICIDTCHMYSAGYDIVSQPDDVISQIDAIVGINKLRAIHLNDTMTELGSRKDRHAKLGEGLIGVDALVNFITKPELANKPLNLETPNEIDGYKAEIELIRSRVSDLEI